ncbi:MAG: hypothetical protein JWO24_2951 [Rhodospirillales bacterium]|nr:hypothetical protein [Rhodospirillales bacterium]
MTAGEILIFDTETDNLLDKMTKLHCVQIGQSEGSDSLLYGDNDLCDRPLAEGISRLKAARHVVGHNAFGFDLWVINHFFPGTLQFDQVLDTLVLARMTNITERNHSLDAWGRKTGTIKGSFKGPYDVFTPEFAEYSRQDIHAGRAVWHAVKHGLEWGKGSVYDIEARAAYCLLLQEQNGFTLDVAAAQDLHATLAQEQADHSKAIHGIFSAFSREEEFIPKVNNAARGYVKGQVFLKQWEDAFNPRSRQMIAEHLQADGWEPTEFTPTGQPKIDEETLLAVNHPGGKLLVKYLKTAKVIGTIIGEGKKAGGYLQLVHPDGRIRGRVNTLGAVTWRMAHSKPNMANVDKDPRVRSLFVARKGWVLVGCDGREIQARFLAHYLDPYDDGAYRQKLLAGSKALGTDGHSLNMVALKPFGLVSRDGAKTALYARVFGCRAPRMWQTINEDRAAHDTAPHPKSKMWKIGQGAIDALGRSMPGLDDLLEDVQKAGKELEVPGGDAAGREAARKANRPYRAPKFLRGIGGAWVPISTAHAALVSLLQHGEAVAMKMALGIFEFEHLAPRGLVHGSQYAYCSNVHDEVQFECLPELAEELGDLFSECIEEAGRRLKMRCPLGGEKKVGVNWKQTH